MNINSMFGWGRRVGARGLQGMLLLACMLAACVLQSESKAQVPVLFSANVTLGTNYMTITNSTTVTSNGTPIAVRKNQGIAFLPSLVLAGSGTSNITFTFDVSADGTTYTTTGPLSFTVAATGATPVVGFKLFLPTDINNVRWMRLKSIQNGNAQVLSISAIQYSYFN